MFCVSGSFPVSLPIFLSQPTCHRVLAFPPPQLSSLELAKKTLGVFATPYSTGALNHTGFLRAFIALSVVIFCVAVTLVAVQ